MTNNLGDVRHAMASQPSLYSEERKLLRIQAWEQRNQESCQEQKGRPENVPLFGKPYKTSKWDELSCRIQKMLGSYEDGKDPDLNSGNFVKDLLGSSSNHASLIATLNQRQLTPAGDSTKPSFHGGTCPASTSTPTETLARIEHAAAAGTRPSLGYLQEDARADRRSPGRRDEEDILDMEYARLPPMLATLSPLAEIESPLHSSDGDHFGPSRDADHRGAFDLGAESPQRSLVSPIRPMETPEPKPPAEDSRPLPATKGGGAAPPPQTFPPPLASKASGVVVTRKPTAYVRPMDGQDQVIMESPELKPSPEPYEPLPDKKNNHHHHHHHPHHHHHHHHHNNINNNNNNNASLSKSLPRILEPRPNDAQCVEDILREMTHSWPPLLTTIQTPSASQTPRSPPAAKAVELVQIKHPGKEHYDSPPTESPVSSQQSSACRVEAAHSSGVESASSSDSESSSASESENDSARRRPPHPHHPPRGSSSPAEVKTTAPHGDWQLANWIRSGQQNTGGASQTPPHKPPPLPLQPSQRSSGPREAAAAAVAAVAGQPPRDYKLHVSSDPEESRYGQGAKPQQCRGVPPKHPAEPAACKSPPRPAKSSDAFAAAAASSATAGRAKTVCKKHSAKPGRTLSPKPPKVAVHQAETAQAGPAEDKSSSSSSLSLTFSYRPKVKTKTKRSSDGGGVGYGGPKTERASLPKQKETSTRVPKAPVSAPPCHCGRFPERCVCPAAAAAAAAAPSPGRADRALAAPSVEVSGGGAGVKKEHGRRPKGPKKAPQTVKPEAVPPPPGRPAAPARSSLPSLLVKIDLSLLSRVPFVSAVGQETTTAAATTTTTTSSSSSSSNSTTAIPTNSSTTNTTTTGAASSSSSSSSTAAASSSSSSGSRGKGVSERGGKGSDPSKWGPTKNNKRRPSESEKNPPKKKQKMEKKAKVAEQLPGQATVKSESSVIVVKEEKQKTAKKRGVAERQQQQHCSDPKEHSTDARHGKEGNPKHKKSTKKHKEHAKTGKKGPKSMLTVQVSAEPSRAAAAASSSSSRPMLRFEDRLYPVKHYIKEAKKLKHKADAESDKVSKAFGYLEAAMFFAESGVAMETEPETSKSPYSMYEDTVELIKFTLKQKNSGDSSALPSENDFTVLCLKCQSFLQMAMFRCKHKVASKYSKTLKTHFMNCKPSLDASLGSSRSADAASPRSFAASPALAAPGSTTSSSSSGPGSNHSCGGGGVGDGPTAGSSSSSTSNTVSIPKIIHHVAFSYVNITALFVSAHDLWEKAEALTHRSSGVLSELNAHMEPLSLSSSMKATVQYTRQALHWLRLDAQSLK